MNKERKHKRWDSNCVCHPICHLFFNEAWRSRKLNSIDFCRDAWFQAQDIALAHDIHSQAHPFPNLNIAPGIIQYWVCHVAVPNKWWQLLWRRIPIWGWRSTSKHCKIPFLKTKSSSLDGFIKYAQGKAYFNWWFTHWMLWGGDYRRSLAKTPKPAKTIGKAPGEAGEDRKDHSEKHVSDPPFF